MHDLRHDRIGLASSVKNISKMMYEFNYEQ